MTARPGSLQELLTALTKILQPLEEAIVSDDVLVLLAELGIEFPSELADDPGVASAIDNIGSLIATLPDKVEVLDAALDSEDFAAIASVTVELIDAIRRAIHYFDTLASAIDARKNSLPGLTPQEVTDFVTGLPRRLIDYLVIRQAETGLPAVGVALDFIGLFDRVEKNVGSTNPLKPAYIERSINVGGAFDFLASPSDVLKNRYQWGAAGFDGSILFAKAEKLALELGLPAIYTPAPTPTLDLMFLTLEPRTDLSPPGIQIDLNEPLKAGTELKIPGDSWELVFAADAQIDVGSIARVTPAGDVSITPPAGELAGIASVTFRTVTGAGDAPFILIGDADASRLEFKELSAHVEARLAWNASLGEAGVDLNSEANIREGLLIIDLSGADGFIGKIVGTVGLEANFDIGAGYSTVDGFHFHGSGGLEIQLPVHVDLGVIELQAVTISASIEGDELPIGVGADIKANLGPLQAVVEGMGVDIIFSFPDDGDGNLGPMDLGLGFKPPNGVGLSLDAGAVKGGGYLFFDFDREEYAGALELVFSDWIALKAVGLITTKMPDGSKGFSLLIIITVEFGTGLQLGFGFTLIGVGGLLGLNRIVNIDQLKDGIRTGAIESVMFPQDVIANAPRIISDLRRFFPPKLDIFLVGPLAKIGWGTPSLVSAQLGVVLEFPSVNITILGVIKLVLPDEKADILRLQVNFIGRLEPSNKLLWFYAELFDSRVLFITLEGGFGLLVNWGDNANFVVSVGGFHPKYDPPALPFPEPPRIAVNILNESFAKVRIEGYFAVTSNSVQFGARAELYFGLSEFRIEGHLAFDALFQFDPFYFSFGLSVSLSVKVFGIGLFSIGFSGLFEGPTPWYIEGKGKIKILFFSISVPFKHRWGDNQDTKLDPIKVFPLLEAEFAALTNWEARGPANSQLLVSLRKLTEAETDQLVLHPVGKLRISQRKMPINFKLDKVGNNRPSDVNRIAVDASLPGAGALTVSTVRDNFAIGQFRDLDGSSQLSSPGFEPLDSGIEIAVAGEQLKTSRAVRRVIRYESIIIDNNFKRHVKSFFAFFAAGYAVLNDFLFTHFLTGSAVTQSIHSQHQKKRLQPFEEVIETKPHLYSVVSTADNRPHGTAASAFASQAQAQEYMEQQTRSGSAMAGDLHVIPNTDLDLAA